MILYLRNAWFLQLLSIMLTAHDLIGLKNNMSIRIGWGCSDFFFLANHIASLGKLHLLRVVGMVFSLSLEALHLLLNFPDMTPVEQQLFLPEEEKWTELLFLH